ncbi:Rwp-rk domain [Globisporangium polare]
MLSSPSSGCQPPHPFAIGIHSPSASQCTSGESAASTPVSSNQQYHSFPQHQPMMNGGHPRLHLNTMLSMDDEYMRSPTGACGLPPHLTTPKQNIMAMSPACNFEAFSLHFHLPLKTAAEKFGVRATAFKKRCRAIGIRHWPYRKVRSLKRSLQELNRCKDQGALNDKQQYQYATFKKQLDKLMTPETYGIDPSGRIPHEAFDDSEDESDDDDSSTQSPRYGTAAFVDCNISPAEGDKTFGDFSSPAHLRAFRNKHSQFMQAAHFAKSMNQHFNSPEIHTSLHRLQQQQQQQQQQAPLAKEPLTHLYSKFPYGMYDPYAVHGSAMEKGKAMVLSHNSNSGHGSSSSDESEDMSDHPGRPCALDHQPLHPNTHSHYQQQHSSHNNHGNFLPTATVEMKYEDVRALNEADDEFTDHAGHMDYNNDRFFDDVFLQISPDYGCLV